ncbi:MAG: GspH/FimT family pseudopilin [Sulfuritalea sp.]|nr:GspH/FimT family pseudopilin [Sulfuritalea sp.]
MVSQCRRASGFTLIELLVVIAIGGILMSIAVPGIKSLLNVQKIKSATFDLVTTAMLARSEAIKWSGASSSSISIAAPSNNFSNGWCIVFTSTTTCSTSAPGDGVMQIIKPTSGVTYAYQGTAAPIVFTRTGRLAGGVAVTLLVTDDDNFATPRCVTFDTNGNARVRVMAAGTTSCT